MKRKIVSLFLIFTLLLGVCYSVLAVSQSEVDDVKNKIKNEEQKKEEVEGELDAQLQEVEKLSTQIKESEAEIDQLTNQLEQLQTSISQKEEELVKKQKEFDDNQELLEERLVAMYKQGNTSYLDVLFNSTDLFDFLNNYYMLSQITKCDMQLLDSIEKEQKEIEETKQALEEEKNQVTTVKTQKESKALQLKNQKAEKDKLVNNLNEEQKKIQDNIEEYNKQMKELDRQIAAAAEAARKAAEEAAKKNNGSSSSNNGGNSAGLDGMKFDGSFIWPCNNKVITSTVKKRWGKWHKGLDIGARYESVYAAASGYAYTAENPGGYGHYIMIFHGDGYVTLYGHLDSYKITSGQYVKQGQVIAISGNSGGSYGAHLHFEVRKANSFSDFFNSAFLNPLDYLPGGYTFAAGAQTES